MLLPRHRIHVPRRYARFFETGDRHRRAAKRSATDAQSWRSGESAALFDGDYQPK